MVILDCDIENITGSSLTKNGYGTLNLVLSAVNINAVNLNKRQKKVKQCNTFEKGKRKKEISERELTNREMFS